MERKLCKIAVTGGLSCGKSTVCQFFQKLGAYVVSADEIVHQLLTPECELGQKVIAWLGPAILHEGKIARKEVAKLVFADKAKLKRLQALLYPTVGAMIQKAYEDAKNNPVYPLFIAEVPLLFEANMARDFDVIITVAADPSVAQKRFKGPAADFTERDTLQMPLKEKMEKSTFTLFNNSSLHELQMDVLKLFNQLKSHEP